MTIQWFPGHMAKARREIEENLKLVDVVLELVDARAPQASQNPMLQEVIKSKRRLMILMKKDLADTHETEQWLTHFRQQQIESLAIDVNVPKDIQAVIQSVHTLGEDLKVELTKRGVSQRPLRALILGIPNVGKSTLINRLAHKRIARIGDRPGITRHQQWIKVRGDFELLD